MKLFSYSYLNEHEILKNAVIGFELEVYSKHNYPQTLEIFNRELAPFGIKVWGFKQYHSKFKPDDKNFKIEPDLSGGFGLCELVTGKLDYTNARLIFSKLMNILQKIGHTTERCGVHINISFNKDSNKSIERLNPVKLILNLEEMKIYNYFPDRENNVYAKSIKNIIPYKDFDYSNASANILTHSINIPDTKYYGVNFSTLTEGRLEFRYLGGENYQNKVDKILDLMDYFILISWECTDEPMSDTEIKMLRKYLDDNIRKYKSLSKIENFFAQFPTVDIQVDKRNDFEIVSTYYNTLYSKIYDFLNSVESLEKCIINFDSETKNIEVVGAKLKFVGSCSHIEFIDCETQNGEFSHCGFITCKTDGAIMTSGYIDDGEANNCKMTGVKVDNRTEIKDCYYSDGYFNGTMIGGVLRSAKLGKDAHISDETKRFEHDNNFFNLNSNEIDNGKGKKMFGKK